jgi:hypothetical protein
MTSPSRPFPIPIGNLRVWAQEVVEYFDVIGEQAEIEHEIIKLTHKDGTERAVEDGLLMWDPQLGEPVYTKSGVWTKLDGTPA